MEKSISKSLIGAMALSVMSVSSFAATNSIAQSEQAALNPTQTVIANAPVLHLNNQPLIVPHAPNLNANGFVLMDADSGRIIAEKNMDQRMQPASLTKLMTLFVTAEALSQGQIRLDDKVKISRKAWQMGGSKMFIRVGNLVPVSKLIEGIIVASGNDACVAIAQYIAGNEKGFANLMNQTAQQLGMKNTHYVDSTGLPNDDHYSTPYDMALLTRAWIKTFPQYYPWFKQKWITWNKIKQPNRNRLLWRDPSVDGLKTGHTSEAGYCLISSAKRNDMRLISVIMGTPTDAARNSESERLLNWGFRFYETKQLYAANQAIIKPRVWLAKNKKVPLGLTDDLYVTVPRGQANKIKAVVKLPSKITAPVTKGKIYGQLLISLNGKTLESVDLVALNNDQSAGFGGRIYDHIVMTFKSWFGHS